MAVFDNFPGVIAGLLQQGFLARELEEGLDSILAYRRLAVQETFPGRIGETLTRTRKGRRTPIQTPMIPTSALDNGMVAGSAFSIEQYSFTMREYADTLDLNLMAAEAEVADQFLANARNLAVQAAQSLERICRNRLFSAYLGGNSRLIADPGGTISANTPGALPASVNSAASSANIHLDDIRGFTTVLVNGVVTPVSGSNILACTVTKSDGTTIAVELSVATAHTYQSGKSALDITNTPDAVPGFVTLKNISGGTWTVAAGDSLTANTAPAILRPQNRYNTSLITGGDVLSLGLVEDGVAYLRDNGIPPMDDGTYHCILDNTSMRQLFADQDFKTLFAGRSESPEWRDSEIIRLLGITYIPTTEAYVQGAISAGKPKIRRPIIAGAEAIIQSNFEGMETYLSQRGFDRNDSNIAMVDGVLQIVREPLDRLQQMVAQTWTWIGDYAVPTDITANSNIIPTASNATYKRCLVIEHAG